MKLQLILALMMTCAGGSLHGLQAAEPAPTADKVVATMFQRDVARESQSGGYTGAREYVFENGKFQKHAQMLVRVTCDQQGVKHFEVMAEHGWKSANKHVLRAMLATESDSSHPDTRPLSRITSDNYEFRMVEVVPLDGRNTYVIEANPRRQDKSLFRGRIWVDAEDYALVRVEGEPAKNPSFWVHKVHFVQQYQKAGAYWFPVQTTSVTDARIFGTTDVTIRYFDYKPAAETPSLPTDYSRTEARYAKR